MSKKNLIIGAALNYDYEELRPFINSLQKTNFSGDVTFLVAPNISTSTVDQLKKQNINFIKVYNLQNLLFLLTHKQSLSIALTNKVGWLLFPFFYLSRFVIHHLPINSDQQIYYLGKTTAFFLSITSARYFYYYKFITNSAYDKVLITDIRDVVFQRNPFDFAFEKDLLFALENSEKQLKDDHHNKVWIRRLLGEKVLQEIGGNIITCAGTVMGSRKGIIEYLKAIIPLLAKKTHKIAGWPMHEQAGHNYLVWKKVFDNAYYAKNEKGPILTMSSSAEEDFHFDKQGRILNHRGKLIPVIHQYDRFPKIKKKLFESLQLK